MYVSLKNRGNRGNKCKNPGFYRVKLFPRLFPRPGERPHRGGTTSGAIMEPLNPVLYQVLQEQFGDVRISNEGEPRRVTYTPEYTDSGVRLRAETIEAGE